MMPLRLSLVLLLLLPMLAHGATYTVSPAGNDGTSCATPKRTITAGLACLSGGDTLLIGAGTYAEIILAGAIPSGTSSQPTVVKADPPLGAILQPTATTYNAAGSPSNTCIITLVDQGYITLDSLVVDMSTWQGFGTGIHGQAIGICAQGSTPRSRNLPRWARDDPHAYFRAAEAYERAPDAANTAYRGVAFEEWKITLPHELTQKQNRVLMRNLVDMIAGDTLPITYAFHCPQTLDGLQAQPHLHLLISTRHTDGIERTPAQHFKRYNAKHPERGGARKARNFSRSADVKGWRVAISDVVNLHLERAGIAERVHPESLKDRGIEREPEPKLLPSESRKYRDEQKVSPRMQEVLEVRAQRKETRATEQANARAYWEVRKDTLGLTTDMDLPTQLAAIGTARALVRDQVPMREVVESYAGVELDDRALGDLGHEALVQLQAEAETVWGAVQDERDRWALRARGTEAEEDAWRDAVLLWAEETGARALRDVGWEAVQEARDEGQDALEAAVQMQRLQARVQAWGSLEQDLAALARQLDALGEDEGRRGPGRVRLWDKEEGMGR